jgi:hypothetical protein
MKYKEEDLVNIPKSLFSHLDDQPFSHCLECNKYLLDDNTEYLIEKICKHYPEYDASETVFDYALCINCATKLHNEMSKESRQVLIQYFQENIDETLRQARFNQGKSIADSTSQCLVSGEVIDNCNEYQICAHCIGDKVYMGNPPYMLSSAVLDEIMGLLSQQTQDIMNGFYDKHRTPAPGLYEPDPKLVLV